MSEKNKILILFLFFILSLALSSLLLNIHDARIYDTIKSVQYSNLQFDSHSPDPEKSSIKEFSENSYSKIKEILISFKMKIYSITYYNNVFQTGPVNTGIRIELFNPSSLALIIGNNPERYKIFTLTNSLQLNKWYSVKINIDYKNHLKVYLDDVLVTNVDVAREINYDISEIAIGTGLSKTRLFDGALSDFNISYNFLKEKKFVSVLKILFILMPLIFAIPLIKMKYRYCINEAHSNSEKNDFLVYFICIFSSLIIFFIIAFILSIIYKPDKQAIINIAESISVWPMGYFIPEPFERLLFLLSLIFFPISFFIHFYLLKTFMPRLINNKNIDKIYIPVFLFSIILLGTIFYRGFMDKSYGDITNFTWYLGISPFYTHFILYMFIFFPLIFIILNLFFYNKKENFLIDVKNFLSRNENKFIIGIPIYSFLLFLSCIKLGNIYSCQSALLLPLCFLFYYYFKDKYNWNLKLSINRGFVKHIVCILTSLFSFLMIFLIFSMNIFTFHRIPDCAFHFNAIFYSVVDILSGKNIAEFNNTYGLYPYLLKPIFNIVRLNVLNFTVVMSFLLATSLVLIYLFLKNIMNNKFLVFLGFTTIVFLYYLAGHYIAWQVCPFEPYFQYTPLRIIFPALLIYFASVYLKNKNKILYLLFSFILSLSILWNIETGIIVFLTWTLVLLYDALFIKNIKERVRSLFSYLFINSLILFLVLLVFSVFVLNVKNLQSLHRVFTTPFFFYKLGFNMLPMPIFHLWNIILFLYFIGIAYSIKKLIENQESFFAKIILMLSLLGLGTFTYYQGRSHNSCLTLVSYPFLILVSVLTDKLGTKIFDEKRYVPHIIFTFFILLFFLSGSIFGLIDKSKEIKNILRVTLKQKDLPLTEKIDFIIRNTDKNERIILLSFHNQGILLAESKTYSVFSPAFVEMFLKEDYKRLVDLIKNNKNYKIFMESEFAFHDIRNIVEESYIIEKKSKNGYMLLFSKKL